MSKFRKISTGTKTINLAGGEAFSESPKMELVSLLVTSFVNDKFYEKAETQLDRLADFANSIKEKEFVAKAAIYTRTKFGMRSITHALIAELAKNVKGTHWLRGAITKAIFRPDDMLEILAYYIGKYGKRPIPNSLKYGLRDAINKFDSYQLAKYKGSKSDMKMIDLFNIVHPKVKPDLQEAASKLIKGNLASTETWEAKLSQTGQEVRDIQDEGEREAKQAELKKEAWVDLIKSRRIGYFALLKNLRNILQQAPDIVDEAIEMLTNERLISKSLVLPFRFYTALNELKEVDGSRKVLIALSKCMEISLSNVPKFEGKTLVVLDGSSSMTSVRRSISPCEIGAIFAAILYKANDADLMQFANDARYVNAIADDSIYSITKEFYFSGGSTNFHSIFSRASRAYDRIIILSDMQGWMCGGEPMATYTTYKLRTGANPFIYSFDLNGYGTLMFPERNVFCLAGFSEKVFDIMAMLETDKNAMIHEIEKIEL